jgi:hypothetical protein
VPLPVCMTWCDTDASKKLYIAMKGTAGEVVFTAASTNGAVKGRLLTTMFGVTCKGYLIAQQGDIVYNWKALDDSTGTKLTTAASAQQANDTIVLLPKDVAAAHLKRRSYATMDELPRCESDYKTINYPVEVIAQLKRGARGNNPNGCGPNNGIDWVPDWSFGRCCDAHDNCYDDCGKTYGGCNSDFYNCMHGKCGELTDIWNFWLRPACEAMAVFYYSVVQGAGQDAFHKANKERCECVCPNTSQGFSQSLCQTTQPDAKCIVTGGDDNANCGGCGWQCPRKTHCSLGNCACDGDTCGNLCLNLLTHPRNCGSCGNVCKSGYCWQGACYEPPPVSDVCYPVDGITDGDFSSGLAGWSVGFPQWGSILAYGSALGDSGATIMFTLDAGTASFSQDVRLCEGTDYELDFSATREGARKSCSFAIQIAGRSVASRPFQNAAQTKIAYGPYTVPTLKEGDAQTYKNGAYLNAPLSITVSCDAGETPLRSANFLCTWHREDARTIHIYIPVSFLVVATHSLSAIREAKLTSCFLIKGRSEPSTTTSTSQELCKPAFETAGNGEVNHYGKKRLRASMDVIKTHSTSDTSRFLERTG